MIAVTPDRWKPFWLMLAQTLDHCYGSELARDDVMVFSRYLREPVQDLRQQYPNNRMIVYQAEPLLSRDHYWNPDSIINNIRDADEIWDYDYENYLLLQQHGLAVKFRPMLCADPVRSCGIMQPRDIDVLVYGLFSERRGEWLHHLHMGMNPDKTIYTVCNVMHPEIDRLIERSKVIVNWHQHPDQRQQEQTRLSFLLTNGKHVVSERSSINYYGDLVREFDTVPEMIDLVNQAINSYDPRQELDRYHKFSTITQQDFLERALAAISTNQQCQETA